MHGGAYGDANWLAPDVHAVPPTVVPLPTAALPDPGYFHGSGPSLEVLEAAAAPTTPPVINATTDRLSTTRASRLRWCGPSAAPREAAERSTPWILTCCPP
jgi:hypothetical protein